MIDGLGRLDLAQTSGLQPGGGPELAQRNGPLASRILRVFPPLPDNVETVDFFMPSSPERRNFNGEAMSERGLSVKNLRKDVDKTYRQTPLKRGRIIY